MRTTVTLDADVQALLKKAMRRSDRSFKRVLNDAVRAGLGGKPATAAKAAWSHPVFDMGEPLVDLTKALALAGELEDLDTLAKLRAGK